MKKTKKTRIEKIDGLSARDIQKLRSAIRQVWSWSHPRRLALKRALLPDGFSRCEQCQRVVAKVYADHIRACGDVLQPDYIRRVFCSSSELQALCKKCHDAKTRDERRLERLITLVDAWLLPA